MERDDGRNPVLSDDGSLTTDGDAVISERELLSNVLLALIGRRASNEMVKCIAQDRVQLESDLHKIIQKIDCTSDDVELFSTILNSLVKTYGYTLNGSSLLFSAAKINNIPIVLKLLLDHCNAQYHELSPDQETILHIACRLKSILRYVYVLLDPILLVARDNTGNLPIHIACHNNDAQFVTWLFGSIINKKSIHTEAAMPVTCNMLTEETITFHFMPPYSTINYSKIAATNMAGQSVYHITVCNGYWELLRSLLDILELKHKESEWNVIVSPDVNDKTPLDLAIMHHQVECLKLLLEFLNKHSMLQIVVQDPKIMKSAADLADINIMKLLVEYGFSQGLEYAISTVLDQNLKRLLLYYYTQLTSTKAIIESQSDYGSGLTAGWIEWNGVIIEELDTVWIDDSLNAMATVSRAISHAKVPPQFPCNLSTIQNLASECLKYFESLNMCASELKTKPLIAITRINIPNCSLKYIPPELFQLPNLEILNLSNNCLQELPSAVYSAECIYSSQSLKRLVLDDNQLKTLPEDLLLGLVNTLEHLSVQKNELSELPPGLWVMSCLKSLNLSENKLSQLHYFNDRAFFDDPTFSEKVLTSVRNDSHTLHRFRTQVSRESSKHNDAGRYMQHLRIFYETLHKATGGKFHIKNINEWILLLHEQRCKQKVAGKSYAESTFLPLTSSEPTTMAMLSSLNLSHNRFTEFPQGLPCLAPNLQKLSMHHNHIKSLNLVCDMPQKVVSIALDHNIIEDVASEPRPSLCMSPCMLLQLQASSSKRCNHTAHRQLRLLSTLTLGYNKLKSFQAVDTDTDLSGESTTQPTRVPFPQLIILSLEYNELTSVPSSILQLTTLNALNLAHNTGIVHLPSRLGLLSLYSLNLEGLSLEGIPISLIQKPSTEYLLGFLKGIHNGKESYRHMKLMLVGSANVGKTTLLLELTKKGKMVHQRPVQKGVNGQPLSTVGAELGQWEYFPQRRLPTITFMTWDFGGQDEYYATHQCFISHRSLYLVIWDAREGERGLRNIKPWLENIEARAHNAPVIVVGTHSDCLHDTSALGEAFKRLYVEYNHSSFAYPRIQSHCFFVNCFSSSDMERLRKYIYEFTRNYRIPGSRNDAPPLLDDPIPLYYMKILKIIQCIAKICSKQCIVPIFTKDKYLKEVVQCGYDGNTQEIVEASSFWHDNGIILYHKGAAMDELYCVDPQWLSKIMANVITVKQRNPYHKHGFMNMQDFSRLCNGFSVTSSTQSFVSMVISIMQSFEVILLLDQQSILIPSLLSPLREHAYAITYDNIGKLSVQSFSGMHTIPATTQTRTLLRHFIIPFIPNGFFSRLISRISTVSYTIERGRVFQAYSPWLVCWREGVSLFSNGMEVLKIAPVTYPLPGTDTTCIVTGSGHEVVQMSSSIEVRIAASIASQGIKPTSDMRASFWLLQQAIMCIQSIFDDWYIGFGQKRGFELSMIQLGVPCDACEAQRLARAVPAPCTEPTLPVETVAEKSYFLFSAPFCAYTVAMKQELNCPIHGTVSISKIAPDLVFGDFPSSMIYDAQDIVVISEIGRGGFGAVFSGTICRNVKNFQSIAIKKYVSALQNLDKAEISAWERYQEASREARVMKTLVHDNILGLLGVTLAPLMLLLELAPRGDLKVCVERFQQAKVKLSVRTMISTLIQVAKALDYMHSKKMIFRDLKPQNILVWKFPLPASQGNSDAVYVKLADYGICQQYTPQGVRGAEGTPPYLPPEVLLHWGQESHSTKLDVYSFGMLMYYLFTFEHPFYDATEQIRSLLEKGRRPSLLLKHCPSSVWLLESMCWCWSQHPFHRPNFQEIITKLKDNVTSRLISAVPVASDDAKIVASCAVLKSHLSCSLISAQKRHDVLAPSYLNLTNEDRNYAALSLDIWCAFKDRLKCIEYQAAGHTVKDVDPLEGECICMVATSDAQIWISTSLPTGGQLSIYDSKQFQRIAAWSSEDPVRKLLYSSAGDVVVAIGKNSVHVFSIQECNEDLKPIISHPTIESFIEVALIGVTKKGYEIELWCSTNSKLKVLEVFKDGTTSETFKQNAGSTVEHMAPLSTGDDNRVKSIALSHGTFIEKWDVDQKELLQNCNCYDFCSHLYDNIYGNGKVTSLLYWNENIYVGTECGAMLALTSSNLIVLWVAAASDTPITHIIGTSLEPQEVTCHNDCRLIISFGGYTGVYKGSNDIPPSLNPPGKPESSYHPTPHIKLLTAPSHATHMFVLAP